MQFKCTKYASNNSPTTVYTINNLCSFGYITKQVNIWIIHFINLMHIIAKTFIGIFFFIKNVHIYLYNLQLFAIWCKVAIVRDISMKAPTLLPIPYSSIQIRDISLILFGGVRGPNNENWMVFSCVVAAKLYISIRFL